MRTPPSPYHQQPPHPPTPPPHTPLPPLAPSPGLHPVQAEDDPIAPKEAIPFEAIQANPRCLLVLTPTGGHLGWCGGPDGPTGAQPRGQWRAMGMQAGCKPQASPYIVQSASPVLQQGAPAGRRCRSRLVGISRVCACARMMRVSVHLRGSPPASAHCACRRPLDRRRGGRILHGRAAAAGAARVCSDGGGGAGAAAAGRAGRARRRVDAKRNHPPGALRRRAGPRRCPRVVQSFDVNPLILKLCLMSHGSVLQDSLWPCSPQAPPGMAPGMASSHNQ